MKPFAIHQNSAVIYFMPAKQFRHSMAIPLEFMSEFSSELQMALPKILLWIGVKCRFSRWSTVFAVWEGPAVSTTTTDFFLSSLYRWHFLRTILMDLCFLVKNFLEICNRSWEHLPYNPEKLLPRGGLPFLCCILMKSRGGCILHVDPPFMWLYLDGWWILQAFPTFLCSDLIKFRGVTYPLFF